MTAYGDIRALNFSTLKHLHVSPKFYQHMIKHPEPPKAHYLIGNGIHCYVLEPDEFENRYAEWDMPTSKGDKLTARNGAALEEWTDLHYGAEPLLPAEMENVKRAGDAVLAHKDAKEALKGCRHEEPLTWTDPDTGLACKGRVDAINPAYIVDLKSTKDIAARAFYDDAAKFLYHCQLSFYQTGAVTLRKIDGKQMPYLIAVEKEPPYDVSVDRLKPDDLHAGRQVCLRLMRRLLECQAANYWPGKAPDLRYMDLPPYAAGLSPESEDL